jgi:L-ascorbate metabolism protein UlaG (beta-lactamase superfamily)
MRRAPLLILTVAAAFAFACGCSKGPRNEQATPSTTGSSTPSTSTSAVAVMPVSPRATDHFPTSKGDLAVVPLEHASVLFQWNNQAIYVDPPATAVADPALPKADIVFITDIHQDHMDPAGLEAVRKTSTQVVAPQAVADKMHVDLVMQNGDTRQIGDVVATAVPMYNVKRGPGSGKLYHDKGRGNGYDLDFRGPRVYLSGDTECTPEMRTLEKIDVAFVCMNLPYTMPPSEAAECIAAFKPKVLLPYHYRGSNVGDLDAPLAGKGIDVRKREWYPGK